MRTGRGAGIVASVLLTGAIGSAAAEQAASTTKTSMAAQATSAVKQAVQPAEYDFGDYSSQTLATKSWN